MPKPKAPKVSPDRRFVTVMTRLHEYMFSEDRKPTVEFRRAKNKQHYFVIKAANGEIVATSELYKRKKDAVDAMPSICVGALQAWVDVVMA